MEVTPSMVKEVGTIDRAMIRQLLEKVKKNNISMKIIILT